jgi:SpoVK/Ycf46/Vps4 family AAA+-type ATPase
METTRDLLKINLKALPLADDLDLDRLAASIKGYSGAGTVVYCLLVALMPRHYLNLSRCRNDADAPAHPRLER